VRSAAKDLLKEVLGFWLGGSEGESSDIWMEIFYELQGRIKAIEVF